MNIISNKARYLRLQKALTGFALGIALAITVTGFAHADDDRDHSRGRPVAVDQDWRGHEEGAHRYWGRPHFETEPQVVYAPPVVYSPPVYEEPGINFIIPLNIR